MLCCFLVPIATLMRFYSTYQFSLHNTTLYEIVDDWDKIPLYNHLNNAGSIDNSEQQASNKHRTKRPWHILYPPLPMQVCPLFWRLLSDLLFLSVFQSRFFLTIFILVADPGAHSAESVGGGGASGG